MKGWEITIRGKRYRGVVFGTYSLERDITVKLLIILIEKFR